MSSKFWIEIKKTKSIWTKTGFLKKYHPFLKEQIINQICFEKPSSMLNDSFPKSFDGHKKKQKYIVKAIHLS